MSRLNEKPSCNCCLTIAQYIDNHLDPENTIRATDLPDLVYGELQKCFGEDLGIDIEDLEAYISELRETSE